MEFEQILKLVDHVSASHLESYCYESDGVKLTLNNKIAPVIIPGTMQNSISVSYTHLADWSRKRSCRLGSSAGTGGEKTHR